MKDVIWKTIAPEFKVEEFGEGWEKLESEILVLIYGLRRFLPDGARILINCAYEDRKGGHGKGRALDFRIVGMHGYTACINVIEAYLRTKKLENLVAFGIYPEWGVELGDKERIGLRPGFHLEAEEERREQPRRWGARYKKNENGTLFLRDGKPVQEYVTYEAAFKSIKRTYTV